jgi:acyl phosphate:glycerol-3-phosphate acyltransferase
VAPVFASFRGGKGVATTLGGYLGLDPALALVGLATWATGLLVLRRFVLAAVTAIVATGIGALLAQRQPLFAVGAIALTLIAHRHDLAAWKRGEMPTIREALRDNRRAR